MFLTVDFAELSSRTGYATQAGDFMQMMVISEVISSPGIATLQDISPHVHDFTCCLKSLLCMSLSFCICISIVLHAVLC